MGFSPRIAVNISNNKCWCCEDPIKPQPNELAVFYSEKHKCFVAKLDRDNFSLIYKDLIALTERQINDAIAQHYSIKPEELPDYYRKILVTRLPSLKEVYDIEKAASIIFTSKSSGSVDAMAEGSPLSPPSVNETKADTPSAYPSEA